MAAKDPKVRELLGEFQQQKQLQQADFKTPYTAPAGVAVADELLVTDLAMTPGSDGRTRIVFGSKLPGSSSKQEMQLDMDAQLLGGLLHLLENAFEGAQWQALEPAPDAQPADSHAGDRPKYLN
jgi:hypothetical protein